MCNEWIYNLMLSGICILFVLLFNKSTIQKFLQKKGNPKPSRKTNWGKSNAWVKTYGSSAKSLFWKWRKCIYVYVWIKKVLFLFLATSQKYRTTQVGGNFIRLSGPNFYGKESGGDNLVPCPIASWKLPVVGTLPHPWVKKLYQKYNQIHFKNSVYQ